jgi:hypothetical protein
MLAYVRIVHPIINDALKCTQAIILRLIKLLAIVHVHGVTRARGNQLL